MTEPPVHALQMAPQGPAPQLAPGAAAAIESIMDGIHRPRGPGAAAIVTMGGKVAHRSSRGLANIEYAVPITHRTTFHVASLSKQFAAFAMAVVADRGGLDVDDDIRDHLPGLPPLPAPVTARQLAHHTSGMRDQWGLLMLSGWRLEDAITTDDVLRTVYRNRSLDFTPQTSFRYSNTGYTLIGELVRAVDGRSLRQFCDQELFAPLGMTDTHFHDDHQELVEGRAYSYHPAGDGTFRHALLPFGTVGATGLHTTVEDLARWDRNFAAREVGSDGVFALMEESGVLLDGTGTGYAFGLMHDVHRGVARAFHPGNDAGFRAYGERYASLDLGVYLLANSSDLDAVGLARRIGDVMLDHAGVDPAREELVPAGADAAQAGTYVDRATGETLELRAEQDRLTAAGLPLSRRSDGHLVAPGLELEPAEDRHGLTVHVVASMPRRMHRVTPVELGPERLQEYVGTFWSDELETRYVVELAADTLRIRQPKLGAHPLAPTIADHFVARRNGSSLPVDLAVAFDRVAGVVQTMRLSLPRVHNVQLVRCS